MQRVEKMVQGSTGTIVSGGKVDVGDCFVSPTLIQDPGMEDAVMQEEIFGPILQVTNPITSGRTALHLYRWLGLLFLSFFVPSVPFSHFSIFPIFLIFLFFHILLHYYPNILLPSSPLPRTSVYCYSDQSLQSTLSKMQSRR